MTRFVLLAVLVAAVALPALACRGGRPRAVELTDEVLRAMSLAVTDLPPNFGLTEDWFSSNADLARYFSNPERAKGLLDGWGRVNGYGTLFTGAPSPDRIYEPFQVSSAVERHTDAWHARQRWSGRWQLFADWTAEPVATTSVRAPRIGNQSWASRMLLTDAEGRELVVYSIIFRQGPVVADITTTALKHKDDTGWTAYRLARLVHERVNNHVPDGDAAIPPDDPNAVETPRGFVGRVKYTWREITGVGAAIRQFADDINTAYEEMQEMQRAMEEWVAYWEEILAETEAVSDTLNP